MPRVPIPIVLVLCLIVVGMMWWRGTRGADFLTPPPEEELAAIRTRVEASLPRADSPEDAISVPSPPAQQPDESPADASRPVPVEPEIDPGDLVSAPRLSAYSELGEKGASHLIELASLLESEGHFQRAMLAWERVLDSTGPDEEQAAAAMAAARRLRPTLPDWNVDPVGSISIVLHAGTGKKLAENLKPILAGIAGDIRRASSGIIEADVSVAAGSSSLGEDGPVPVAMWISGGGKDSPSTDVLSFTVKDQETLPQDLTRTIILLIRNHFEKTGTLTPPSIPSREEAGRDALEFRVTRLSWQNFGISLNQAPDAD